MVVMGLKICNAPNAAPNSSRVMRRHKCGRRYDHTRDVGHRGLQLITYASRGGGGVNTYAYKCVQGGRGGQNMTKNTHFVRIFIKNATTSESLKDRQPLSMEFTLLSVISSKNKSGKNDSELIFSKGKTAVNSGHFAVLPLRMDDSLVVSSNNIHDIYLNTQLGTKYNGLNIVEIYAWTDI